MEKSSQASRRKNVTKKKGRKEQERVDKCSSRKHLFSVEMSSEGNRERQRHNAGEERGPLRMAITESKGERSRLNKGNREKVSNKLKQRGKQAAQM